jgi:hypothetical protein
MVYIALAVAFCLLFLIIRRWRGDQYIAITTVAFVGHLFVSFILIPRLPYQWDISQYHQTAMAIATGTFVAGSATVSSFGAVQGVLYTLFAEQPQTVGIFNGLCAVLIAIPAESLARNLYPTLTRTTPAVVIAVLFMPLPFLFLSIPMRDTLTVLLFFTLLAMVVHAFRTRSPVWGLPAIPLWGMVFLLRTELALMVFLGVVASGAVGMLQATNSERSFISLGFVIGGIGVLGFSLFAELLYSFERVNTETAYRSTGGAVYLDGMEYQSWFDFLLAAPVRGLYFQFAPFPLHVESLFHLLALFTSSLIIVLFVSAVRSLYESNYDETVAVLLVVIYIAGIVGYGTINSNFGTNVRHRIVFDFLLVVSASPVLHRWWLRVRSWVSVVPGQSSHENEQEREA